MRRSCRWHSLAAAAAFALLHHGALGQEFSQGLRAFEGNTVGMAERTEASKLTDAGVVSVGGAGGMVITLAGELRARAERDGAIGLLLIPDLPFFDSLYRNRGILLSAAEVTATVAAGSSSYFIGKSTHTEVGFARYRLLLFNTTGANATVNVYVYPTRN